MVEKLRAKRDAVRARIAELEAEIERELIKAGVIDELIADEEAELEAEADLPQTPYAPL